MTETAGTFEAAAAAAGLTGAAARGWVAGLEKAAAEPKSLWVWDTEPIHAVSMLEPWLESRWPPRSRPRLVRLHGGHLDGCSAEVWALGEHLTISGDFYTHETHDDDTADYRAVGGDW